MSLVRIALVTSLTPNALGPVSPSLGILTLASILRPRYHIEIVYLNVIWRESGCSSSFHGAAAEAIVGTGADVVGFSSISGSYPATIRLAQQTGDLLPECHI